MIKLFDSEGFLMSASTPGEEQWADVGQPEEDGQLLPAHAYSIIIVKETHGHKLLNIRNPWGSFEWDGDWSSESPLWTPEIRKELNPMLEENDGTFWMSFNDFTKYFRSLNV